MSVTDRVATALACSAVDPFLTGLLFYDLDPRLIYPLARWLANVLDDTSGDKPLVIPVGQEMTEEMLWGRIEPEYAAPPEGPGFGWKPGLVTGCARRPGIVVVPDLTLAGIPGSRAAVALVDADVAHLERSGVTKLWRPRDRWLAAARRLETGHVSAHLLDRFAVRIDASDLRLPRDGDAVLGEFASLRQAVLAARRAGGLPELSADAADQVVEWIPPGTPGSRRELALARLARALAALARAPQVLPAHVDSAASLTGLAAPAHRKLAGPWPEDVVQPRPDTAPLRVGWRRALTGPPRGAPIGAQHALDMRDIAIFASLLNAAQYQRLRCQRLCCPTPRTPGHQLHVRPPDLLSHRRAPQPGYLLVLVLDHTCRGRDWDWITVLGPYLRWGYVNRALVGVVEMGHPADDRRKELRASQFQSRSVFDPAVLKALDCLPGRAATPLAHGLTLAARMLRYTARQTGALVSAGFLVVVTDGRANVPLAASQTALPPEDPVGRVGITDAEAAASKIRKLHHVRGAVIYPGPLPSGHFAASLAAALGAPLVHGTPPPAAADLLRGAEPAGSRGASQ